MRHLCLPPKISLHAVFRYVPGLVPVHCVQRCIWPHIAFYKKFVIRMSPFRLMFTHIFDADTPREVSMGRPAIPITPSRHWQIQ